MTDVMSVTRTWNGKAFLMIIIRLLKRSTTPPDHFCCIMQPLLVQSTFTCVYQGDRERIGPIIDGTNCSLSCSYFR